MAPSLGRFSCTRATCVAGWMMLQRGTESGVKIAYTSVDCGGNEPWYSERRPSLVTGRTLK
jgi:hypothetical protein